MLEWLKRRRSTEVRTPEPDSEAVKPRRPATAGAYRSLHKYLDNRYANVVVLTFAQIEDLLGFALPASARLREEWWTNPDPNTPRPGYSDAWVLARRTAQPNLRALTVMFERAS